jgi:predicted nucleotidyltransferase
MLTIDTIKRSASPLVAKYGISRLEIFGSCLSGTATEDSDADFLVDFGPGTPSIFKVMGFREELSAALGKPVDIVTLPIVNPGKLKIGKSERLF